MSALPAGPAVLPGELGAVAAGGTGTLLLDAGPAAPQEAPRLGALDAVQRPAQHSRVIHLAVGLAAELRRGQRSALTGARGVPAPGPPPPRPHLHAAVAQLLLCRGVPAVVHRLLALHELIGAAGKERLVREAGRPRPPPAPARCSQVGTEDERRPRIAVSPGGGGRPRRQLPGLGVVARKTAAVQQQQVPEQERGLPAQQRVPHGRRHGGTAAPLGLGPHRPQPMGAAAPLPQPMGARRSAPAANGRSPLAAGQNEAEKAAEAAAKGVAEGVRAGRGADWLPRGLATNGRR